MSAVHKQNKFFFYVSGYSERFLPHRKLNDKINMLRKSLSSADMKTVEYRVNYYNKLSTPVFGNFDGTLIKDLLAPKTPKAYYFDTYQYAKYFDNNLQINYAFGDVNTLLDKPSITKSRPIDGDNSNNVLLNLDKARHFVSVKDSLSFEKKKDQMIGRAAIFQNHRVKFYKKYFNNPLCDLGQVNKTGGNQLWIKPKISIIDHLKYKFILSLEGNDVATNLKWIMSSNSLAVCPPLKMETWYMEGTLVPDEHFIGISEDYSNLEEKLHYYIEHPKESEEILKNAKLHRNSFCDKNREDLIALLVLKKYFELVK